MDDAGKDQNGQEPIVPSPITPMSDSPVDAGQEAEVAAPVEVDQSLVQSPQEPILAEPTETTPTEPALETPPAATIDPNSPAAPVTKKSPVMLIILAALGVLILGTVAYGYYQYSGWTKLGETTEETEQEADVILDDSTGSGTESLIDTKSSVGTESPSVTDTLATWKTYENTTYGFNLTLTDNWTGYSTYEKTPANGNAIKYIYFLLPTSEKTFGDSSDLSYGKKGVASPFAIGVYTLAGYEKEKTDAAADGRPITTAPLGQNNKYVFTFTGWQDGPSDLLSKDLGFDSIKASIKTDNL